MPKCDFKKFEITLRQGCSPANLPHIFRTPFLKNTSGRLFLLLASFCLVVLGSLSADEQISQLSPELESG